ncbi:MAG: ABC transporter permease subunit [Deltaproteobacteria bacterium]|nr:ABC transporter permease subunit [Deltaproteobacteria bacterium]
MLRLVLSRLAQGTALLLALSFVLFGVMAYLPGDPVDLLVASNPTLSPADVIRLKKLRGLDQPFPIRWWRWLYGHHEAKAPPPTLELPAIVGTLPAPRPFVVDVVVPAHPGLTLTALPPATIEGEHLQAVVVDAGALRLLLIARDVDGQEALWSLPLYIAPPPLDLLPTRDPQPMIIGDDDDDPQMHEGTTERQTAGGTDLLEPRTGTELRAAAVAARPLPPAPATIEDPEVSGQIVKNDVVVSGAPLIDPDRFVCGVACALVGDTRALGWSWATKRPVAELLFGVPAECGDGLVQPGEDCDDRHRGACPDDCVTTSNWLDTAIAGALAGQGRIGNTLVLTGPALLLSMLLSLALGTWAALRKDRAVDVVIRAFAAVSSSVPAFFVALVLITLFAEQLQWFPSGGMQSPGIHRQGAWAVVVDRLQHLLLPLCVLVIFWSGRFVRQVRSAVLSAANADYVRTARSKGASSSSTLLRHILPNASLPLVTLVGLSLPTMFGGALLTETVFAWPGLGRLQYDAILANDSYVAVVVFLMVAAMVLAGSLLADVLVFLLDPRLRARAQR